MAHLQVSQPVRRGAPRQTYSAPSQSCRSVEVIQSVKFVEALSRVGAQGCVRQASGRHEAHTGTGTQYILRLSFRPSVRPPVQETTRQCISTEDSTDTANARRAPTTATEAASTFYYQPTIYHDVHPSMLLAVPSLDVPSVVWWCTIY